MDHDKTVIIAFQEDPAPLPGKPPEWARHLHDCTHRVGQRVEQAERRQQEDRHALRGEMQKLIGEYAKLGKQLDLVLQRLGAESDDGKAGTGLIGEVRRMGGTVGSLMAERNMVRGAMAAIVAVSALLLIGLKSWLQNLTSPPHG